MPVAVLDPPAPPIDAIGRRGFLAGAGAAAFLAGCGAPTPAADPQTPAGGRFPLTVTHSRGTTEIPKEPQRVACVGYSDQDPFLALGVRPIAVTDWYGDYPYATWPWAQPALGDAQPVVLNKGQFTGTPSYAYEQIAALGPDVIVGLYTGMDDAQYRTLSRIAPTVAPPAGFPEFGAPWQEYTRLAGRVLGRSERAEQLIADVDAKVAATRAAHPQFVGRTAVVAERTEPGQTFVRSPRDQRSQLLSGLGFVIPPEIGELSGDQDGVQISDERLGLLDRDVLLWNIGFNPESRPEIEGSPLYGTLDVVKAGRSVFVEDPIVSAAWTWGTVLSLPGVVDAIATQLAAVIPA